MEAQQCSSYMVTLQQQIRHIQSSLLAKYSGAWYHQAVEKLAARLVYSFVRYMSLVRPFGEEGKLKAAADMAQLEFAIAPLHNVSHLGKPYQVLRSLRPFIFRDVSEIPESPEISTLPPSVVLHHLFARASPSLQSPHIGQIRIFPGYHQPVYVPPPRKHSFGGILSAVSLPREEYQKHIPNVEESIRWQDEILSKGQERENIGADGDTHHTLLVLEFQFWA